MSWVCTVPPWVVLNEENVTSPCRVWNASLLHCTSIRRSCCSGEESSPKSRPLVTHLGKKTHFTRSTQKKRGCHGSRPGKAPGRSCFDCRQKYCFKYINKSISHPGQKQDAQAINELCEIINDLVSDREQLLGISRGLEEQFTAQHISDDEIRHLIETVIPAIKNFISKIGDESALQAIDQFTPVALYRHAGSSPDSRIQLLCSDRRAAHGTSSLLYPLQNDTQH